MQRIKEKRIKIFSRRGGEVRCRGKEKRKKKEAGIGVAFMLTEWGERETDGTEKGVLGKRKLVQWMTAV